MKTSESNTEPELQCVVSVLCGLPLRSLRFKILNAGKSENAEFAEKIHKGAEKGKHKTRQLLKS